MGMGSHWLVDTWIPADASVICVVESSMDWVATTVISAVNTALSFTESRFHPRTFTVDEIPNISRLADQR